MKKNKINKESLYFLYIFILLFLNIPIITSSLKCAPDFKSKGDNYSSINDPQDNFEYFYGYEFAHRAGEEYYDHWKGIYWDSEPFCYEAYDNYSRPSNLDEIERKDISEFDVVNNLDDVINSDLYILIDHDQSNLLNFHKKMFLTKNNSISNNTDNKYELLIKMDKLFEDEFIKTPHHFYFTIENPFNYNVTFSFKTRNFIYYHEEMKSTLERWGPNESQCIEEEEEEVTDKKEEEKEKEKEKEEEKEEDSKVIDTSTDSPISDITKDNQVFEKEQETVKPTTPPCERDWILINETFLNWTEEYPIPEVFYFTNNYTIEPHKSMIINISLTFEKNINETEGGYFIISGETGKSKEPYYWPIFVKNSGKLEKLTNMEIILESDLPVGISSFSLMRRRELEESSYLGKKCNVENGENILSGRCGDGFYCDTVKNGTCKRSPKKHCKNCDINIQKCTECFLISVDGQWNPPGGKGTDLACDLD